MQCWASKAHTVRYLKQHLQFAIAIRVCVQFQQALALTPTHLAHTPKSEVSNVHTALGQHSADLLEHAWSVRVVQKDNVPCWLEVNRHAIYSSDAQLLAEAGACYSALAVEHSIDLKLYCEAVSVA